jgi:hypothetical protein
MHGRGQCCVVGNPGNAGAKGHPCGLVARERLEGEACGIPHLAKNERDVGHPAMVAGIEPGPLVEGMHSLHSNDLSNCKIS